VRDNIHSHDVVRAMEEFAANPRPGEVYNMGGGRENSISMLESIEKIEQMSGKKLNWKYIDENRKGDHICYISDLSKFKSHYPNWKITIGLDEIFRQIIADHTQRLHRARAS
jgi:CDP-paratose 2-epimerase